MKAKINHTELFFDVEGSMLEPRGSAMIEKPVCFFLHGGPVIDAGGLRPWLSPLADVMQMIYVDYRGSGRSMRMPLEEYTLGKTIDDLEALRNHLGLDKIVVLGHSFGGILAMPFALKYQHSVSLLILMATSPYWGPDGEAEKWANLQKLGRDRPDLASLIAEYESGYDQAGLGATDEDAKAKYIRTGPMWFHRTGQDMISAHREMADRTIFSTALSNWMMKTEMRTYDMRPQLGNIRTPTLVMAGRWDWRSTVEKAHIMHTGIPDSELVIFENSSHMFPVEEQEKCIQTVAEFVRRRWRG